MATQPHQPLKYGFCANCDVKIAYLDLKRKTPIHLPNFREHQLEFKDGGLMTVNICDKCLNTVKSKKGKILERILKHWEEETKNDQEISPRKQFFNKIKNKKQK